MSTDEIERRLAAILSADVAGYSRLMAQDQLGTIRTITSYRDEIADLVRHHRGRLVDATGDNALGEFPTALDAVECAVEIQRVLAARNELLAHERRMELRIGVHLGDIAIESGRIYGDGVNISARLQAIAEPGGISISAAVNELVSAKLGLNCEDLGERQLKNIPNPVRVFHVRPVVESTTIAGVSREEGRPSIAVLPFANMSPDPEQEYFCDGMAEEVINALAHVDGLHVAARTSAFAFKGRDVDVRTVGVELGVRAVLEGSVRKSGGRLRVTAQLIDVTDGYHLWSERYERQLDDVFAIQDEISANIVAALKLKLVGTTATRTTRGTDHLEAYDLYLRGMYSYAEAASSAFTTEAFTKSVDYLEKALEIDPDFAPALAGVSVGYGQLGLRGHANAQRYLPKAEASARRAIELDDALAEGHSALGTLRAYLQHDFEGSGRAHRRAIQRGPSVARARSRYAEMYLTPLGRTRDAVAEARKAHELDPLSPLINRVLALALFYDRQYDSAIAQYRHTLEMAPDHWAVRGTLAIAYLCQGLPDEAVDQYVGLLRRSNRDEDADELESSYATGGEAAMLRWHVERDLEPAEKRNVAGGESERATHLARFYARLGEPEQALYWLKMAASRRGGWSIIFTRVHPWFDDLQGDSRFEEVLKSLGLDG